MEVVRGHADRDIDDKLKSKGLSALFFFVRVKLIYYYGKKN